jgi:anti-anti-sigma factor
MPAGASELSIRTKPRTAGFRVSLAGELTLASVDELRAALKEIEASRPPLLVIDLSDLDFLDSTGIGELLAARRRARAEHRRMVLTTEPGQVERILKVAGMQDVFDMADGSASGAAG